MISSAPATYLLNPGPVNLSERVRQALLRPDLCHREPEYSRLQDDVRERLAAVYPADDDEYTAVLLTGSGTAAVEAMIASLVLKEARVE
jgi:2-aminoethylphosphonate-pyruvate transaminase